MEDQQGQNHDNDLQDQINELRDLAARILLGKGKGVAEDRQSPAALPANKLNAPTSSKDTTLYPTGYVLQQQGSQSNPAPLPPLVQQYAFPRLTEHLKISER